MFNLKPFIIFLGILPAMWISNVNASTSDDGLWSDTSDATKGLLSGEQLIKPDKFRLVTLNQNQLQEIVSRAPLDGSLGTTPVEMSLPLPDGTFSRFQVVKTQLLHPDLAAKFPDIKTYRGWGVDNPSEWVRFDATPHGFHGFIRSDRGTVYIDPYLRGNTKQYMSYFRRDYQHPKAERIPELPPETLREPVTKPKTTNTTTDTIGTKSSGSQLRVYRLAVAATGEYTQAVGGGTVVGALSEITTAINRVDGIYRNEIAIGLQLIANNDTIIYTNGLSDPYTNSDAIALLTENQTNLDSQIGNVNYDLGHVFSTGGGGLASLAVACWDGHKARGETGSSNPIGDAYYVDYVAHEMGHQLSANHTFNGNASNCNASTRNSATAYEPGSGSTIMAYAGICSPQDVQTSVTNSGGIPPYGASDAYFHVASLNEIITFTTDTRTDYGGSCGTTTSSSNNLPSAVPGTGGFTIPASTPFMLMGSATDGDPGDAITFTWEQYDTGSIGVPVSTNTSGPLFRSRSGTTDQTRYFPQLSDILNGNNGNTWEVLPSVTRSMTFQLTVRDNSPVNIGGVDWGLITFNIDGNSGPFLITSQNSTTTLNAGDPLTVTWDVAGTNAAPVNCNAVDIALSTDGGQTFLLSLATSTPNDGTETVVLPNTPTSAGRVRVVCSDNIFFDINNADLTINAATPYDCSGVAPVVSNKDFILGETVSCIGSSSVTTSGTVRVLSGAVVDFIAPIVTLSPGFSSSTGASFSACTASPCP